MVELFKGIKVDWLGKRKLFFFISIVLLVIGMTSLIVKGEFRYGMDFKGGTLVRVRFNEVVDAGAIRALLPNANIQEIRSEQTGTGSEFQVELEKTSENEDASAGHDKVQQALNTAFAGDRKSVV